ncbi:hypothetical protein Cni_G13459 [Canna indica]|uniref:Uncharacterized protein n=1 Tax=Canna indica TaxID=4628 RepID=A0AAQ3KA99_9LILI|nr:hypothetical protein Cni_G13459 [Canna indica]
MSNVGLTLYSLPLHLNTRRGAAALAFDPIYRTWQSIPLPSAAWTFRRLAADVPRRSPAPSAPPAAAPDSTLSPPPSWSSPPTPSEPPGSSSTRRTSPARTRWWPSWAGASSWPAAPASSRTTPTPSRRGTAAEAGGGMPASSRCRRHSGGRGRSPPRRR